jgi:hypothetical protein
MVVAGCPHQYVSREGKMRGGVSALGKTWEEWVDVIGS